MAPNLKTLCFVLFILLAQSFFLSLFILSLPFSIFCLIRKLLEIFNKIWNSLRYSSCFSSLCPFSSYSTRDSQFSFSGHWRDWCEAETPILWPPDAKSWLIWKDSDAGKDWRQEEKGWQRMRWLDGITDSMDMSLFEWT